MIPSKNTTSLNAYKEAFTVGVGNQVADVKRGNCFA